MPVRRAPVPSLAVTALAVLLAALPGLACAREAADQAEAARIATVLAVAPGQAVADVGAGDGEWSVDLARRVGPAGRVYATEIEEGLLEEIRDAAAEAGLGNVTAVLGDQQRTGLAAGCCDAILLRKVYHHLTDPAAMGRDLFAALRPGGRLAVVEYRSFLSSRVEGVPENRDGHGIAPELLALELAAAGFELEELFEEWPGDRSEYCALFRRPQEESADGR